MELVTNHDIKSLRERHPKLAKFFTDLECDSCGITFDEMVEVDRNPHSHFYICVICINECQNLINGTKKDEEI